MADLYVCSHGQTHPCDECKQSTLTPGMTLSDMLALRKELDPGAPDIIVLPEKQIGYQPCPDARCNDHVGASPIPQCVTAVYWQEEAQRIADVLRELSDRFNGIDCGSCKICHRQRLYDTRGNVGPCSNAECLSHRITEILSNYEKPSDAVLDRIKRNCEQQLFGK